MEDKYASRFSLGTTNNVIILIYYRLRISQGCSLWHAALELLLIAVAAFLWEIIGKIVGIIITKAWKGEWE